MTSPCFAGSAESMSERAPLPRAFERANSSAEPHKRYAIPYRSQQSLPWLWVFLILLNSDSCILLFNLLDIPS
jgi:hypothetical protein